MVNQAESTVEAFVEQKQELIRDLEQRVRDLSGEIENLEKTKKDLKSAIANAFKIKENEAAALEKSWKEKCVQVEKASSELDTGFATLEHEAADFEKNKESEIDKVFVQRKEIESEKSANVELKARNEAVALDLASQVKDCEESLLLAESLEREANFKMEQAAKRTKEVEIRENNAGIIEARQVKREFDFSTQAALLKTQEDDNVSLALIISDKQDELLALKKQLDAQSLENSNKAQKNIQDAEENLIEKKRNEVETSRIKNLTIELSNREAKVTERENLFKTKIGGL